MTAAGPEREPCPDCGDHPTEPEAHRDGCPRIGTCGQIGPPWPMPPFHRWAAAMLGEIPKPGEYTFGDRKHRATMHPEETRR